MDNEMILYDRLNVIRDMDKKYNFNENAYISFSGGKDSTVLHHLIDMALPGNTIPRVFSNTGIEFKAIVEFVKQMQQTDERIVIISPQKKIKDTLDAVGYPFKSKEYSNWVKIYQRNADRIDPYFERINNNPSLLDDYEFIHNLPVNVKYIIKEFYGVRERERESCIAPSPVPKKLQYQFTQDFKLKVSDLCCVEMKEKPLHNYQKESKRKVKILGLMVEEGGRRAIRQQCLTVKGRQVTFTPLSVVTKKWEDWFIEENGIQLCKLYYPPFNFERTGCKGCPYAINIQKELDTLAKYLPEERRQCEYIWKPVYDEYRRIGYRLKQNEQISLFE